jgi:hypothetical protein
MPRTRVDDDDYDNEPYPVVEDDDRELSCSESLSENGEERYAREEHEEALGRMASEGGNSAIVPAAGLSHDHDLREDDPLFNQVVQQLRRIKEAVGVAPVQLVGVEPQPMLSVDAPLDEFKMKIYDHSRCPTTQRKFVPGGDAMATECIRTRLGGFPHIIQQLDEEEGGGHRWHVITANNLLIIAGVHRKDAIDAAVKVSENKVLEQANSRLRRELDEAGEYPLQELRMKMRFVAAHVPHTDPGADPVGVGADKWWDREMSTEIDGRRDKPQLLVPAEHSGDYTQAVLHGKVTYSFKLRQGVTSFTCRKHKRCQFRFVVEPESEVLRKLCPNLTALSEPVWVSAKYNAGRPPKVEGWLENAVEGGPPVKYDFSRKRPRSDEEA